ncbi:MAG: thiamine ABC transporter substrate-binding protein [Chloroflexi bacterium]|nr:thiamine ABC transporter substrate-binding protein [Chloroflexota bacterium]
MKTIVTFAILCTLAALAACASPTPTAAPPTAAPTAAVQPTTAPQPTTAAPSTEPSPQGSPTELVVVTHDSFAVSEQVLKEFETTNNAKVQILESGDAGAALNKAILAGAANPLGDVFFGVDNTFFSRALKADLFEPYKPNGADAIPTQYRLDSQFRLTPIDYGDVCLNYDIAWFKGKNLAPPQSLDDLTKPEYKSLLVVENPATSSPGLAFLLATIGKYGPEKYLDYWQQLRANDVAVSEGWEDAYYTKSTWSGKGDRPIVVSYATSPAAEVFFSDGKYTTPPTGNVLGDSACFRQIEFAGVFKNAKHADLAKKFLDFMVAPRFQEDIPTQMFVFPVNPDAKLPEFYKFAETPKNPAQVGADAIDANRDAWIKAWTQAVLR